MWIKFLHQISADDAQVDGDVNYHIVNIIPTVSTHLERTTPIGQQIKANHRFRSTTLNQF